MTEEQWRAGAYPMKMLWVVGECGTDRKLRLIAVAFCRRVLHLLRDEEARAAEVAERCADGLLPPDILKEWHDKAELTGYSIGNAPAPWTAAHYALGAVGDVVHPDPYQAAFNAQWLTANALHPDAPTSPGGEPTGEPEHPVQAEIIRDILGDPFRPVTFDSSWLTDAVVSLARAIYDERDFERMPELADALEKAGCNDRNVLGHCREGGPHVRGCWVVDLALGKS